MADPNQDEPQEGRLGSLRRFVAGVFTASRRSMNSSSGSGSGSGSERSVIGDSEGDGSVIVEQNAQPQEQIC